MSTIADQSIAERFARIARLHADREAIGGVEAPETYATLDATAQGIAALLLAGGVQVGERVGLYFDRQQVRFAALLGALQSGALAVPMLSTHPAERLRQIASDADVRIVLCTAADAAAARDIVGTRGQVLTVDSGAVPTLDRPAPRLRPTDAALILYTSGSTGRPKGVLQTHGFVLHKFDRAVGILGQRPGDRMTFFSTFAVGQGFNTIMLALLSGATLCPFDVRRDGLASLVRWMVDERITFYISSATLLRSLLRTLEGPQQLPHLRRIRIGGERIDASDVAAARERCPEVQLLINYSTTETGAIAIHPVPATAVYTGLVPVGRPLDGLLVRIIDEDGRPVPPGSAGEVVVESEQLSSGYWNDPERTARSFTPTDAPRVRAYRTGDLGRLREDGQLEHLGRKDLRVKIRGFRIEIEEVETLLNQDPEVLRAAVAAKPDGDGDLRLVAYIQPLQDANTTVERLRARLSVQLPEHAIPSTFVMLDTIPLTESGKIDRQQLPDITDERPVLDAPLVLPRTPLEATVAEVWREVLGLAVTGIHDSFLSVGGDSLKATLVASRLAARIGRDVPLSMLFEASTIAELAALLGRSS